MEVPQKTKIELPYDPAIPLVDIYPKKMKTLIQRDICSYMPYVHSNIIYNYYLYIHTYKGLLLSHKKEWNNAICSNMDRPRDYHTKWSESDRETQISYDMTYMWNLKKWYKWTYLQNEKTTLRMGENICKWSNWQRINLQNI